MREDQKLRKRLYKSLIPRQNFNEVTFVSTLTNMQTENWEVESKKQFNA